MNSFLILSLQTVQNTMCASCPKNMLNKFSDAKKVEFYNNYLQTPINEDGIITSML